VTSALASRAARSGTALVLVGAAVLAGCSGPDRSDTGSPEPHRSSTTAPSTATIKPSPSVGPHRPASPEEPAAGASRLADQLERVGRVLRDRGSSDAEVRRAAELQQLAVRLLAKAPGARLRRVAAHLDPRTAAVLRSDVGAAAELRVLNQPRPDWPPWHVVAPPPAEKLLGYYRLAQRRTGVPWQYLAAVNLVETDLGRIRGPSTAGALGPMQFLPATWRTYGGGGDINDPHDAILGAARLLAANGAPRHMAQALWHYNPSSRYVRAVTLRARVLRREPVLFRGYWHWRVLLDRRRSTYVLPVGYPRVRPVLVGRR
jgi:membrane-bound lytic murein transglycosylase B